MSTVTRDRVRRGLPRVPGGEPWPPARSAPAEPSTEPRQAAATSPAPAPVSRMAGVAHADGADATLERSESAAVDTPVSRTASARGADRAVVTPERGGVTGRALRRGLPRVAGGEPWPPEGFAPERVLAVAAQPQPSAPLAAQPQPSARLDAQQQLVAGGEDDHAVAPGERADHAVPARAALVPATDLSIPLPFPQTVFPGAAAREWNAQRRAEASIPPRPAPQRYGPFTKLQWAGAVIVGGGALLVAAAFAVLIARWLVSLEYMREFLITYPGEYPLPEAAPVGFPAWLAWQHFFNVFLIVLIIRTGITVHNEKRPSAFWSPRTNKKRKISLALWFHQSLDILWLVNGLAYVVLLFATAQWMRIVPTSWEVFPNAISAGLQYVSLVWPTENGWVNYNSLQQLAYFATVFIAAPLATITGIRMSGVWPKSAQRLNRLYPVEWARRIHFPVMVYFVAFIIVHVALVFATNALRNLNHMYGGQDAVNWTGFWIFIASMVVVAAGWVAARPLVLAPIARLFGTVSGR